MSLVVKEIGNLIFANKPAGMLVHRTPLDKYETEFLVQNLRDEVGKKVFPIHRLDKATSGLVMFTTDSSEVSRYQELWTENNILKSYYCFCRGWITEETLVDYPIEEFKKAKERTHESQGEKKEAISKFKPLAKFEVDVDFGKFPKGRYSLVEVEIQTGRRHQIRRHAAHLSHPILGDSNYGDGKHNRFFREKLGCPGLLLQSKSMIFTDPVSNEEVSVELDLDQRIAHVIEQLEQK